MPADRPIAVIQGAATPVVQALMRAFIASLGADVRVAGAIEAPLEGDDDGCSAGELKNLGDGRRFALQQELGASAEACRLDSSAVVSACEAVLRDIERGADLVVLSKFGKVEAERSGLAPALARAMELGVPVLTSVAPKFNDAWDRFAAPYYVVVPPDLAAVETWWRAVRATVTREAVS